MHIDTSKALMKHCQSFQLLKLMAKTQFSQLREVLDIYSLPQYKYKFGHYFDTKTYFCVTVTLTNQKDGVILIQVQK